MSSFSSDSRKIVIYKKIFLATGHEENMCVGGWEWVCGGRHVLSLTVFLSFFLPNYSAYISFNRIMS